MVRLNKKMFIGLLISIINASNHTECVLLSNQKLVAQPTLYITFTSQWLQSRIHCYRFAVKLDRCVGSCNTLNHLSNKVCIPNKTGDLNLSVFNMIRGIINSETSTKHVSCEWEFIFDGKKCNSDQC